MAQLKDKDCLNGYKNKTPIYAVYKRRKQKRKGRKKTYKNKSETINMAIRIYLSINTLNGLNALPKDKDWMNGYKNKTPIYVVYKIPTSKQGTHTD